MKKILIVGTIILFLLVGFFYALFVNPYQTKSLKILDCESTYNDYYFNKWSLRDMIVKPQPSTEFSRQFAQKEVGMCLYEKYFKILDPKYKTELLKLFKNSNEVIINAQSFEINEEIKAKSGLNQPKNPVDFNQYYLE
jgi:hypothetical protein